MQYLYININIIKTILIISTLFLLAACEGSNISGDLANENPAVPEFTESGSFDSKSHSHTGGADDAIYSEHLAKVNEQLLERGIPGYVLKKAETLTYAEDGSFQTGQTIFATDRTLRLGSQWVPGDERRGATDNSLTYLVFEPLKFANGSIDSEPEIDASFDTWNDLKNNLGPEIVKVPDTGVPPSAIIDFGVPGDPFAADIVELGFLPGIFFDIILGPGASTSVLGVAFTFVFLDGDGNLTNEVALKEIWYNDNFAWSTDGTPGTIDIQSVALHENGHALGFGHFGKISITNANGKLHVSPRAVMNAAYLGVQRDLLGTDRASFNSVYGSWPKD